MTDILIRNVPEPVLESLKRRAEERHRSLQHELLSILETASAQPTRETAAEVAAAIRARLAASGRSFGDSVELIREDRER